MVTTRKLTTTERRAKRMCEDFAQYKNGDGPVIVVKWTKSRTWGMNPSITYHGETVARVSGCGYDKLSAVLAEALRFLGKTHAESQSIHGLGGCGVESVRKALLAVGWDLRAGYTDSNTDAFSLIRVEGGAQ